MESLINRFDAVQEAILSHIESGSTTLKSQIEYWENVRKENIIMHYARKQGLTTLGMQPLPTLAVTEYNAKEAIKLSLTLQSLLKSPFGTESWTLTEVSAQLINTPPQNCLKKNGYEVEVWFDDNKNNAMVYPNWDRLYYQDANEMWHLVKGEVDYDGCYFVDHTGDRAYFTIFNADAERFSETGKWTVHYKTQVISSSIVSSTSSYHSSIDEDPIPGPSTYTPTKKSTTRHQESPGHPSSTTSPEAKSLRLRRGRKQGESGDSGGETPSKRRRRGGLGSAPSAAEVGQRHRTPQRKGLSRLGLLQEEARDPPLICISGTANSLKCWRYRKSNQCPQRFLVMSTVFQWVGDTSHTHSRLLVAFRSNAEREAFVKHTQLPRNATYTYGNLNKL